MAKNTQGGRPGIRTRNYAELENVKIRTDDGCGKNPGAHAGKGNMNKFIAATTKTHIGTMERYALLTAAPTTDSEHQIRTKDSLAIWPFFGKKIQRRKCLLCDYSRGKYRRYQVLRNIAAAHGYTSRVPNDIWGILFNDKHTIQITKQPMDLKPIMMAELQSNRIKLQTSNERTSRKSGYCDGRIGVNNEKGISTHLGK